MHGLITRLLNLIKYISSLQFFYNIVQSMARLYLKIIMLKKLFLRHSVCGFQPQAFLSPYSVLMNGSVSDSLILVFS